METQLINTQQAINILGCSKDTFRKYIYRRHIRIAKKDAGTGKNYFCPKEIREFEPPSAPKRAPSIPGGRPRTGIETTQMRDVIDQWKVASYDTGSADVQIGVYTDKIKQLEIDIHSIPQGTADFYGMRKALIKYLCERRRLLNYLQQTDFHRYRKAMKLIA